MTGNCAKCGKELPEIPEEDEGMLFCSLECKVQHRFDSYEPSADD